MYTQEVSEMSNGAKRNFPCRISEKGERERARKKEKEN